MERTTLIKSIAQSTPLYSMAFVKFPKGLCDKRFSSQEILVEPSQDWYEALYVCDTVKFVQAFI